MSKCAISFNSKKQIQPKTLVRSKDNKKIFNITESKERSVTVASLISDNVEVRYDEGSEVIVTGDVVLAAPSRLKEAVNPLMTTTPTKIVTTFNMDTSADSNMDTANASSTATAVGAISSVVANTASLTLVKAERPDHLAGTSTSSATVTPVATGSIGTGSNLFSSIANNNKTTRSDDWLATNSPESPQNSLQSQNVVYTTSQQLSEQQQPMAHSSPVAHQQVSNNGYASPMSTGSYDPYSPNGKIGK
ncbi:hypothetical protein P5V15_013353 [Pogonomyrmex californicus]